MSSSGILTYNSTTTTTTERTLETECRTTGIGAGVKAEFWTNFSDDATPQVDTITIATLLPTSDCYYKVEVVGTTTEKFVYEYLNESSDTASSIAARLATLISLHPEVSAKPKTAPNQNQIEVTGFVGSFTTNVECVAIADDSDIAGSKISKTSVAAVGTLKIRKVAEAVLQMTEIQGSPNLQLGSINFYNGANPPVVQSSPSSTNVTGPAKLDALRVVS